MADEQLTGVPKTALGVARIRAGESRREDRLFDDPYAATFVAAMPQAYADEAARPIAQRSVGAVLALHVVVRTRFYDDYLRAATGAGCRQVVLLAAGLDARAFRLDWPGDVRLFELDLPEVLTFKERVLDAQQARPTCTRTVVPADLTADWPVALTTAGFDPSQPTAWLVEGLLVYLSADEAAGLLGTLGELSAAGSRLSCERGNAVESMLPTGRDDPASTETTALWKGGLGGDTAGWLDAHGWQAVVHDAAPLAASFGRPAAGAGRSGFVTATRRTNP